MRVLIAILACCVALVAQSGGVPVLEPSDAEVVKPPKGPPQRAIVLWVVGQSNAVGVEAGFWLRNPAGPGWKWRHLAFQPETLIWWPGPSPARPNSTPGWEPYRTGVFGPRNNTNFFLAEANFGPEATLVDAAVEHWGETVWLFKYARVGALHPDSKESFSSRPHRPDPFYTDLLARWRQASDELRARNLEPEVRGVIWIQGESDHGPNKRWAREYFAHLSWFIADLRRDLVDDSILDRPLPFVISQLHARHVPRTDWVLVEWLIRAAQWTVAALDPDVVLRTTDHIEVNLSSLNNIHYSTAGQLQLGYDLFDSLLTFYSDDRR